MFPCRKAIFATIFVACLAIPCLSSADVEVASNPNYFTYNGKEVLLIGASGDYIPHVAHSRSDWVGLHDYDDFIDSLAANGLNKMRIWIGLNHSPGEQLASGPWPNEQPFVYSNGKWNLNQWNSQYFNNLKQVVGYCQSKGVIVEITMFDPWSGDWTTGPWWAPNNHQNIGFTQRKYFTTFATGQTSHPDFQDQLAFAKQKELVQKVVAELAPYSNVYWEIANEPDIRADFFVGTETVDWHRQVKSEIESMENSLSLLHRPIGVNIQSKSSVHEFKACSGGLCVDTFYGILSEFSVVNGHYAGLQDGARHSAIGLVRDENLSAVNSFNEGKIFPHPNQPSVTEPGVRAEAWEFVFHGGGVYDQLDYNWNASASHAVRGYLGHLIDFFKERDIEGMTKSAWGTNKPNWAPNLPTYGSSSGSGQIRWAAMDESGRAYFLYIHHSQLSNNSFQHYIPQHSTYQTTVQVDLGSTSRQYKVQWIQPSTGNVLSSQTLSWQGGGSLVTLQSPTYAFDIALKITPPTLGVSIGN